MPTKKTTKTSPKKVKEIEKEILPVENATPEEVKKDTPVEKPKPKRATPKKTKPVVTEPVNDAQLFFSTDGSEPEKPASNPYEKEENAPQPPVVKPKANSTPETKPVSAPSKPHHQQPRHNHPNPNQRDKDINRDINRDREIRISKNKIGRIKKGKRTISPAPNLKSLASYRLRILNLNLSN